MSNDCKWLPALLPEPDWNSYYPGYENFLYNLFQKIYLDSCKPIYFLGKIVRFRFKPYEHGKEEVFFHLTCKDEDQIRNRTPDRNRFLRLEWTRSFIENYTCTDICCSTKPLFWKNTNQKNRYKILFHNFLVVLEDRNTYFLLITGFYVPDEYYIRGLLKEYEKTKEATE